MPGATDAGRGGLAIHYLIATIWIAVTVSLASWWLRVGLSLDEHRTMFAWEGAAFIGLLIGGGIAIVLAIRREHNRRTALETFFTSFTHDLKTALARVQLQAEGMREDWPESTPREPLDRLLHDTLRLQIQLENSLFVAQPDGRLLCERVDVAQVFGRLAHEWPDLTVRIYGNAAVVADARAFDAVARNLLQNALVHGEASTVNVTVQTTDADRVRVTIADDGRGVPAAALARLGRPFERGSTTGRTGVGLFVSRQLMARMGGSLVLSPPPPGQSGFVVGLDLPGER